MIKHNYGLAIMLYESNKCGEISEFDILWAQFFWAQEKEGKIFSKFSYVASV